METGNKLFIVQGHGFTQGKGYIYSNDQIIVCINDIFQYEWTCHLIYRNFSGLHQIFSKQYFLYKLGLEAWRRPVLDVYFY